MDFPQNKKYLLPGLLLIVLLQGCTGGDQKGSSGIYDVLPYDSDAHPNLLCAVAIDEADRQCKLSTLPILGMETSNPTKKDIRKRLLVSHTWMGERFMEALDEMPDDIQLLLRSVTAIVIDDDVRPSFYTSATGAIYLDPETLWLTKKERDTISKEADYRAGFGSELNFVSLWRYLTPEGLWARSPGNLRELDDLIYPLSRLLYHELAHANDFLPPASHDGIDKNLYVYQASDKLKNGTISERLQNFSPLLSDTLKDLAKVMFRGEAASNEQKAMDGDFVGAAFAEDSASDDYAYVPFGGQIYYEDTAMLFEELMVKYHFNYDREIAFTAFIGTDPGFCGHYNIRWGQKGRIGDAAVKERARFILARLLPEADLDDFIDDLESPIQSIVGTDWCEPFRVAEELAGKTLTKGATTETSADYSIDYKVDISPNRRRPHH